MARRDTKAVEKRGKTHLLWAQDILPECPDWLFQPDQVIQKEDSRVVHSGRGAAYFFRLGHRALALRHYRRGGIIARLIHDRYLWTGLHQTRPFREWHLLRQLALRGLPVPKPVAARVIRSGLTYQGDLITELIPDATPLDECLANGRVDAALWHQVGATIALFHSHGAWHPDLNVRNILIQHDGSVWLIDWDKGRVLNPKRSRPFRHNLDRLYRSLNKWPEIQNQGRAGWADLLNGYEEQTKGHGE